MIPDALHCALRCFAAAFACIILAACAAPEPPLPDYRNVVLSEDRTDADRVIDQRRESQKLLEFYAVRPGMRVLDMAAGRGHNTELIARVVGPKGQVYAQNSANLMSPAVKAAMDERLKSRAMANVVFVIRDFEDPAPPEARNLDLVTFNFNY